MKIGEDKLKKIITILCIILLSLCVYSADYDQTYPKTWSAVTTIGNGSTTLQSAVTGKRILLRHIVLPIQNACSVYFFSYGTSDTIISPTFYKAANSEINTLNGQPFDFTTVAGELLGVNCSVDPGSTAVFTTGSRD